MLNNTSKIGRTLLATLALGLTGSVGFASDAHYYVNDPLATTVAITDAAGEIAAIEADAFGAPLAAGEAPSRYTGKPYDADLGAYVFPFRNYRPEEGRWMSADPSGFPDGVNGRIYVINPISFLDPSGLKSVLWVGAYGITGKDNGAIAQLGEQQSKQKEFLKQEDEETPSPNYINDGDKFEWDTTTSLQSLASSSFDRIYLAAHGIFDEETKKYTGKFQIGINIYTEREIYAALGSKLYKRGFIGCGSILAQYQAITAPEIRALWRSSTEAFLKE